MGETQTQVQVNQGGEPQFGSYMCQAPYVLRLTVGEFRVSEFTKYASETGAIVLHSYDCDYECITVFRNGMAMYSRDENNMWIIDIYGNAYEVLSYMKNFISDIRFAEIEPLVTCSGE